MQSRGHAFALPGLLAADEGDLGRASVLDGVRAAPTRVGTGPPAGSIDLAVSTTPIIAGPTR